MKKYIVYFAIVMMFIGSTESRLFSQEEIIIESEGEIKSSATVSSALDMVADSVEIRPQKISSRYNWEKALSFPLEIVFLPVELFFKHISCYYPFEEQLTPRFLFGILIKFELRLYKTSLRRYLFV